MPIVSKLVKAIRSAGIGEDNKEYIRECHQHFTNHGETEEGWNKFYRIESMKRHPDKGGEIGKFQELRAMNELYGEIRDTPLYNEFLQRAGEFESPNNSGNGYNGQSDSRPRPNFASEENNSNVRKSGKSKFIPNKILVETIPDDQIPEYDEVKIDLGKYGGFNQFITNWLSQSYSLSPGLSINSNVQDTKPSQKSNNKTNSDKKSPSSALGSPRALNLVNGILGVTR